MPTYGAQNIVDRNNLSCATDLSWTNHLTSAQHKRFCKASLFQGGKVFPAKITVIMPDPSGVGLLAQI